MVLPSKETTPAAERAEQTERVDGLELDEHSVCPMDLVAPGVVGLRVLFVNCFAIVVTSGTSSSSGSSGTPSSGATAAAATGQECEWVLVDAGLPLSAWLLRNWARNHFGNVPPRAIILTHGHFDHVGAVSTLADEWDVPVYAHPLEFPYLNGERSYPAPDPSVGGGAMSRLSPLYPQGPIDITSRLRPLPGSVVTSDNGSVTYPPSDTLETILPNWRWVYTPGHTEGHVSFFRDSDRVLLVGDAFCTTKQESFFKAMITQTPELHGPPAYYTSDWIAAKRSVDILAALKPLTLAPGHGPCISGDEIPDKLAQLAADFDRIALPEHGRYVPVTTTSDAIANPSMDVPASTAVPPSTL